MDQEHDPRCEKLSAYLDDELPPDLKDKVRRHLSACKECSHLHDDFVALIRCCAEQAETIRVPKEVHEALVDLLRREVP